MNEKLNIVSPDFAEVSVKTLEQSWDSDPNAETFDDRMDEICRFVTDSVQQYYGPTTDDTELGRLDLVTRELAANGIFRGNLEARDASDPFAAGTSNAGSRPELKNRRLTVTLRLQPMRYAVSVHDEGPGFDPDAVADRRTDEHILDTHGRGSLIMEGFGFVRKVENTPQGCTVTLYKDFGVNPDIT